MEALVLTRGQHLQGSLFTLWKAGFRVNSSPSYQEQEDGSESRGSGLWGTGAIGSQLKLGVEPVWEGTNELILSHTYYDNTPFPYVKPFHPCCHHHRASVLYTLKRVPAATFGCLLSS
jgi:hypothetical protein